MKMLFPSGKYDKMEMCANRK